MDERRSAKKPINRGLDSDLATEYDFSKGVRGKYSKRFAARIIAVKSKKNPAQGKGNRG